MDNAKLLTYFELIGFFTEDDKTPAEENFMDILRRICPKEAMVKRVSALYKEHKERKLTWKKLEGTNHWSCLEALVMSLEDIVKTFPAKEDV